MIGTKHPIPMTLYVIGYSHHPTMPYNRYNSEPHTWVNVALPFRGYVKSDSHTLQAKHPPPLEKQCKHKQIYVYIQILKVNI